MIKLVDSHCHLDKLDDSLRSLKDYIEAAKEKYVVHFLSVSTSIMEFQALLNLTHSFSEISLSWGQHPTEADKICFDLKEWKALASHKKVIAIGETGLDYYHEPEKNKQQHQQAIFRGHIQLARGLKKPLIVHTRSAAADTLALLKEEAADEVGGVMHCFTENWETAKAAMDLGFYISFSGILTFKNATDLQAVAKKIPRDRLLIETDSPFLAPVPYRGKLNEPAFVIYTAQYLASLRQESFTDIADATTENFYRLFF